VEPAFRQQRRLSRQFRAGSAPREDVVKILSALLIVLGVAVIIRTALAGGGALALGYLLGLLLAGAGALRLYLSTR
jgi:hypothetical protein